VRAGCEVRAAASQRGEGGGLAASERQRQRFRGCFGVEVVGPTMRTRGKGAERQTHHGSTFTYDGPVWILQQGQS
jgi:hypothetical protein